MKPFQKHDTDAIAMQAAHGRSNPPVAPDYMLSRVLAANTPEQFAVPAGAKFVEITSTSLAYCRYVRTGDDNDLATNGAFAADTDWTKGTGWTIAAGVAASDGTQSADADLSQTAADIVEGRDYFVTFTVTAYTAGNVTAVVGGTEGTDRASAATFSQIITAGSGGTIALRADLNFVGSVDNFSVVPCASVPSADDTDGEGVEAILTTEKLLRRVDDIDYISVVAAGTPTLTASFWG